jgi:hypothetical protein
VIATLRAQAEFTLKDLSSVEKHCMSGCGQRSSDEHSVIARCDMQAASLWVLTFCRDRSSESGLVQPGRHRRDEGRDAPNQDTSGM